MNRRLNIKSPVTYFSFHSLVKSAVNRRTSPYPVVCDEYYAVVYANRLQAPKEYAAVVHVAYKLDLAFGAYLGSRRRALRRAYNVVTAA